MVWDPDCVFYCMSLQYYCAGYCIHLLTGSCINKITNKANLSKTSYLQIIAGQNVLGQNVQAKTSVTDGENIEIMSRKY